MDMKLRTHRLIYGTASKSSWNHGGKTRNPQTERLVFQQRFEDENSKYQSKSTNTQVSMFLKHPVLLYINPSGPSTNTTDSAPWYIIFNTVSGACYVIPTWHLSTHRVQASCSSAPERDDTEWKSVSIN